MNLRFSPLGLLLRRLRDERGVTQKELAEAIGAQPGWVSRLERGREELDDDHVVRLVIFLGADKATAGEIQAAADASRLPVAGEAA